jgi:gliding motility-associated-like protein
MTIKTTVLLLLLSQLIKAQTCASSVVPPAIINGVSVTSTSSGSVGSYVNSFTSCGYTTPNNSLWLGSSGVFSYTFNFSQPVNSLVLVITATGGTANEIFTFTTNTGTPTITDLGSCFTTTASNVITSGLGAGVSGGGGGGNFSINNINPYTSLTISGPGGQNGSLLAICSQSVTPTVNSQSSSICQGDSILFIGNYYKTTGVYKDTLLNALGGDSIITLNLTVNPSPFTVVFDTICEGNIYSFGGINFTLEGTYYDTLSSSFGCDSIIVLKLHVVKIKRETILASVCQGDYYLFDGIQRTLDGTYNAITILPNGCDSITTLKLTINPNPTFYILGDSILCNNKLGYISTTGNFPNYLWSTGETSPSISFYSTGLYKVVINDNNNCSSSDSIFIDVINCEDTCQINIPNTFSPNNDGFNDLFFAQAPASCVFDQYKLLIFNRWGQVIYKSQNIFDTWDGTFKGNKSEVNTYIWVLEYKKTEVVTLVKRFGHLNIIR